MISPSGLSDRSVDGHIAVRHRDRILVRLPEIGSVSREAGAALRECSLRDESSGPRSASVTSRSRERLRKNAMAPRWPATFHWNAELIELTNVDRGRDGPQGTR